MDCKANQIAKWYFRKSGESNRHFAVKQTDVLLSGGTLTVLTGKSGSGKTTLLHILGGLLRPDEGWVRLGETDLYAMKEAEQARFRNAHIAIIPQGQSALPTLSVLENVLLGAGMYADQKTLAGGSLEQEAEELLARFDIAELSGVMPGELSGGELRRVAIARALLMHPDVILADEPTGDLDEENTHIVMEALREAARGGAAVLVATHEAEAVAYADEHLNMAGGVIHRAEA